MSAESVYLDIAKLGVSIAGFGGMVVGLRAARDAWRPQDAAGIKHIAEHTLVAALLGLLAAAMISSDYSPATVARTVSAGLCTFLPLEVFVQFRRMGALKRGQSLPRMPAMWALGWLVPALVLLIFQALNVVMWISQTLSLLGLITLLVFAGIQFLMFLEHFTRTVEASARKDT